MVDIQTDDGGEGQHEEQIEGASDWLLACTRGDWGPLAASGPRLL